MNNISFNRYMYWLVTLHIKIDTLVWHNFSQFGYS